MHGTRCHHSTANALQATLAAILVAVLSLVLPLGTGAVATGGTGIERLAAASGPHVLNGEVADVIVRVRGSSICSGTPITGTRYVVTAAHCVLDGAGSLITPTVARDGVDYSPVAILVDPRYDEAPSPTLDSAVLVMDQAIPGPSATLGDTLAPRDLVTLAGFQPIDADGTLLRGTSYHDRPLPKGVTGGVVHIASVPAGCEAHASSVEIALTQLNIPCGLIPGASGGGLFTVDDVGPVLLAVISTVTFDFTFNGLAPLSAVHELINHPDVYTHVLAEDQSVATGVTIIRS